MQVNVTEIEYCKMQATYQGDLSVIESKRQEALKQLRKVQIPGFRAGKAPDHALHMHFKKDIDSWVTREMVQVAWDDVLFETKITPLGQPQCKKTDLTNFGFSCEIEFLKKPDFELKQYKGLEIPKPHQTASIADLSEKFIQDLRMKHGDINPYEENDFVQNGDQITMDFELTTINNLPIEGGKSEGRLYNVGDQANGFPEFDEQLIGMKAGEVKEFDCIMPANAFSFANERVHAKVTVHMGTKKIPHPLNDDLAKKLEDIETFDELKNKVEQLTSVRVKNIEMAKISEQLTRQLVSSHDIKLPTWLTSLEAQYLATSQGNDWTVMNDEQKNNLLKKAEDNVKYTLILDSIRNVEPETVLTDSELVDLLKQKLEVTGQDFNKFVEEGQKNGQLQGVLAALKNEFTMQWLIEQCKIVGE